MHGDGPHGSSVGSGSRRRLDRRGDIRLDLLKKWRASRARDLGLDPGVFCPNITLEEVAWANPQKVEDLVGLSQVKSWWARSFGTEVIEAMKPAETAQVDKPRTSQSQGGVGRRRRAGSGNESDRL